MDNIEKEKAMTIVVNELARLMDRYIKNDSNESELLKEKIDVLEQMKDEINKGNENIIRKILETGEISSYE